MKNVQIALLFVGLSSFFASPHADEKPLPGAHISNAKDSSEFRELALSIAPGFAMTKSFPPGGDESSFGFHAKLGYMIGNWVGLSCPFMFADFDRFSKIYSIGGGPIVRYLNWGPARGNVDAALLYVNANGTHLGWSAGGDLTFGFRGKRLQPFLGPFFRYETEYLPGKNLAFYTVGITLTLTNFADHY